MEIDDGLRHECHQDMALLEEVHATGILLRGQQSLVVIKPLQHIECLLVGLITYDSDLLVLAESEELPALPDLLHEDHDFVPLLEA